MLLNPKAACSLEAKEMKIKKEGPFHAGRQLPKSTYLE
jgi:hypothetical protein